MLREGVVTQEPLVHPPEDDERNDRPERREQPQRCADEKEHDQAGKRHEAVPPGTGYTAALAPLEAGIRTAGHVIDHLLHPEHAQDE